MSQTKAEMKIAVEKPDPKKLEKLGVAKWSIWEKGVCEFDWHYDEREICYFLEGEVTVTTENGDVSFGKGDLVIFPPGLSCRWKIRKAVRKHYVFG